MSGASVNLTWAPPLALGAGGVTLDTPGNAFVITGNVLGTGSLTTTGSGKLKLQPNGKAVLDGTSDGLGITNINPAILGNAAVEKIGTGATSLLAAAFFHEHVDRRSLAALGLVSYSIYMVHSLVIAIAHRGVEQYEPLADEGRVAGGGAVSDLGAVLPGAVPLRHVLWRA